MWSSCTTPTTPITCRTRKLSSSSSRVRGGMHEGPLQGWPFVYSFISACNFVSLQVRVFPDFARQRILVRLLTNGEGRAVGIHEAVALQRLAHTSLVVQDRGEIGVRASSGMKDDLGQEIEQREYNQKDMDRILMLNQRTKLVAGRSCSICAPAIRSTRRSPSAKTSITPSVCASPSSMPPVNSRLTIPGT